MATRTYCDICEAQTNDLLKIKVGDGEHPHCGSPMNKTIDMCIRCIRANKIEMLARRGGIIVDEDDLKPYFDIR